MKLTVITVCYNAEKTIERTFKSICKQTDYVFASENVISDAKIS